jgi:hypothetical protein
MTTDIAELIERVRQRNPDAATELAAVVERATANPDRRVGAAFKLRRRGGEPQQRAMRRAERDDALRALACLIGAELSVERLVHAIHRKVHRHISAGAAEVSGAERNLLDRIAANSPVPGVRQLRRILQQSEF